MSAARTGAEKPQTRPPATVERISPFTRASQSAFLLFKIVYVTVSCLLGVRELR